MSLRLGMPTLIEIEDISQTIKICQKLNLSFIELNMNLPFNLLENLDAKLVKILQKDSGIGFTLHLPDELDLAHFDSSIREGNVNCCRKAIEWAYDARVDLINLHINKGTYFTLPDKKVFIYERYEEQFLENIFESFKKISLLAGKNDIKICVENSENFFIPYINKTLSKISQLSQISFTYDVGHDAKCEYKERDAIMRYENKIKHMHLHDFDGNTDHKKLFSGSIDIKDRLSFAKQKDMSVVIEVKTLEALIDSVNRIQPLLKEI